jgi:hypothetical protein
MSLEEKREIQKAETGWLPQRRAELKDLCGGDVPYEIDWASFEGDVKGLNWLEANGPAQVGVAFRIIGADELGKQALRDAVKKVVIRNVKEAGGKSCAFEGGVLTLACAFSQSPGGRFKGEEIRDVLMAKL